MTKEDLKNVASQASINLKDIEFEEIYTKINSVLNYLTIFDTYEMRLMNVNEQMTDGSNSWREDIPSSSISLQEALVNATRKNENFFKVPKVIG